MAEPLNLSGNLVSFYAGPKNPSEIESVNQFGIYAVEDGTNYRLYIGNKPIISDIKIIQSGSEINEIAILPTSGKAVYEYVQANIPEFIIQAEANKVPGSGEYADMIPGQFKYFDDGSLAFKYSINNTILLQKKLAAGNGLKFNTISGEYGLEIDETKVITPDSATVQTISKGLNLGGLLKVDTIDVLSSEQNALLTVDNNTLITGSLQINNSLTVSGKGSFDTLSISGDSNLNKLEVDTLNIKGTVTNPSVFNTILPASENEPGQFVLQNNTELHFGSIYSLTPGKAILPAITTDSIEVTSSLTAANISCTKLSASSLITSPQILAGSEIGNKLVLTEDTIQVTSELSNVLYLNPGGGNVSIANSLGVNGILTTRDLIVNNISTFKNNVFFENIITFKNAELNIKPENVEADGSGLSVTNVSHRLYVGTSMLLTQQDIIDKTNGLIGKELQAINTNIGTINANIGTINGNIDTINEGLTNLGNEDSALNTKINNYIIVSDTAPAETSGTKLWVDISTTTGTPNGVLRRYDSTAKTWVGLNAVWG